MSRSPSDSTSDITLRDSPPTQRSESEQPTPAAGPRSDPPRARGRSFCFIEREGERWTVFLVTHPGDDGSWRGYFSFRPATGTPEDEVRTTDLWIEPSERTIDARARGLGRPLLLNLLDSALDTHQRRRGYSAEVRHWFRDLLAKHALTLLREVDDSRDDLSIAHLRSLYDSYRIDQVAHLISLIPAADFRRLVDRVLDGRKIDFRSRDRLQLGMLVVQEMERYLPLPPFEVWTEDFLERREEYRRYAHELHRGEIDSGAAGE